MQNESEQKQMRVIMVFFLSASVLRAYYQSDFFGKTIFLLLFVLSVVTWVILIQKYLLVRRLKKGNDQFFSFIQKRTEHLLDLNIPRNIIQPPKIVMLPYFEIYKTLKNTTLELLNKNRYFHQEKEGGVSLSRADVELVESHIYTNLTEITTEVEKNLFLLPMVVTLAPFLGLLGTVWGILITFSGLQSHAFTSSNAAVLSGLSMALATTVVGLVVAIPALVSYNYLKNACKNYQNDTENFSRHLLATVEIQYRRDA